MLNFQRRKDPHNRISCVSEHQPAYFLKTIVCFLALLFSQLFNGSCLAYERDLTSSQPSNKRITWFQYDLPPYHILRGQYQGQGPSDQLFERVKSWFPQYQHAPTKVNVTRMMREFSQKEERRCITVSFIFPESLDNWAWSKALYVEPPAVVVANQKVVDKYADQSSIDFEQLIADPEFIYGHFDKRIYAGNIDNIIQRYINNSHVLSVASYAPGESLMRMFQRGRVDYVVEYLPEIHWLQLSHQIETKIQPHILTIKNHETPSPVHIGCSATPWGVQMIEKINENITDAERQKVWTSFERWLQSDVAIKIFRDAQNKYFFDREER